MKKEIPLQFVLGEEVILTRISAWRRYDDGKPSDDVLGLKYHVSTTAGLESNTVKISNHNSIMEQENLDKLQNEKVYPVVTFTGGKANPYVSSTGGVGYSCEAEGVQIVGYVAFKPHKQA